MTKAIPNGSKMVQEGLFLYEYSKVVSGKTLQFARLYAADGYCFYDKDQPENYDEENNLKPENELTYAQYAVIPYGIDTSKFVCVKVKDGFGII